MSNSSVIDLSKLPTPKVIEELDYEVLFQEYLSDFTARDEEYDGLLESDPAIIILEVMAYREMLVRKRINESAKATLLAFATGSDLDQIVAEYGVERLEGEKDDRLRMRGQMALDGFSTAGPIDAYKFFALSASVKVKSVDVRSDEPGKVIVTILSTEGDGTAVRRESVPETKITVTDGKATLSGKSIDHLVVKDVSGGQTYKENFDYTFDKANSLLGVTVDSKISNNTELLVSYERAISAADPRFRIYLQSPRFKPLILLLSVLIGAEDVCFLANLLTTRTAYPCVSKALASASLISLTSPFL